AGLPAVLDTGRRPRAKLPRHGQRDEEVASVGILRDDPDDRALRPQRTDLKVSVGGAYVAGEGPAGCQLDGSTEDRFGMRLVDLHSLQIRLGDRHLAEAAVHRQPSGEDAQWQE